MRRSDREGERPREPRGGRARVTALKVTYFASGSSASHSTLSASFSRISVKTFVLYRPASILWRFVISISANSDSFGTIEDSPLTSTEADSIIAQREAAKIERKIARLAELEEAEVLSEGWDTLPDGRKVIIREVRPPANEEAPFAETPSDQTSFSPEHIAEQLAWIEAQETLQRHKVQMFSCTVYDRKVTQVRWTHEGESYLACI